MKTSISIYCFLSELGKADISFGLFSSSVILAGAISGTIIYSPSGAIYSPSFVSVLVLPLAVAVIFSILPYSQFCQNFAKNNISSFAEAKASVLVAIILSDVHMC